MPNGGVPRHMILYPAQSSVVMHCTGRQLGIYARDAWDAQKAEAEPLALLGEDEGAALAWFLRYWLGESRLQPGYDLRPRVDAEFEF